MRLSNASPGKPDLAPPGPIKKRATCGPLIFFLSLIGRTVCCSPQLAGKQKDDVLSRNSFLTYFDSKHPEDILGTLLKQSILSKNTKIDRKPKINSKPKIFLSLYFFFQGKKTHNLNSHHHMKPFDIKINCFGGLNLSQQQHFLYKSESGDLIFLLYQKKD